MRIFIPILVIILSFYGTVAAQTTDPYPGEEPLSEKTEVTEKNQKHNETRNTQQLKNTGNTQKTATTGTRQAHQTSDPVMQTAWQLDARNDAASFGPLGAYRPYFDDATSFGLSFVRYRPRGYDWRWREQRINGIPITDWFRGAPAWNTISSLSSVGIPIYTENPLIEDRHTLPWQQQRSGKVSLSTSNRSYTLRGNAGYNSGENSRNGWAYSLFGSRSWGKSYMIDGLWNDSWALFGSLSKSFGPKTNEPNSIPRHRLALTAWYAPSARSQQSATTAEAYALAGNNLYNPAWGNYGSRERSANIRAARQPIVMLTHQYTPSDQLSLQTTLSGRFGTDSYTGLNWQNAPNPRPDYYRNMPSFQTSDYLRQQVTDLWRNDINTRQIDWQALIDLNANDTPRAHYILESRIRDYREFTLSSNFQYSPANTTRIIGGLEILAAENLNYKRLDDLLGATYWLDIDTFIENDDDNPNLTQSDMHHPNRHVREGDSFGYKYSLQTLRPRLWAQLSHRHGPWDLRLGGSLGLSVYHRFGYYDKENFPSSESFGWSPWVTNLEWDIRATAAYNIGNRLRAGIALTARSLAPTPQDAFISPEYRNALVPNLRNQQMTSLELTLDYRTPYIRAHFAGYWTQFSHRTEIRSFYDDFNHYYCNYLLSGINARHTGIELSAEIQLAPQLWLKAAGIISDNRYTTDPKATELRESTGETILTETVYYRSLHIPNGPQTIGILELEYTPRSWIITASLNSFARSYISPTPLRRTQRTADQASPEQLRAWNSQERFSSGATLDLFLGRTIYLPNDQRLGLYAGVNNLLDRRDIRTSGYESSRMRNTGTAASPNLQPLDSKYYYALGLNFFVTASWRF